MEIAKIWKLMKKDKKRFFFLYLTTFNFTTNQFLDLIHKIFLNIYIFFKYFSLLTL